MQFVTFDQFIQSLAATRSCFITVKIDPVVYNKFYETKQRGFEIPSLPKMSSHDKRETLYLLTCDESFSFMQYSTCYFIFHRIISWKRKCFQHLQRGKFYVHHIREFSKKFGYTV